VMALSRKEPTVKAKFRISSWALQLSHPFIQLTSSCSGSVVPPTVPLVTFSVCVEERNMEGIPKDQRGRCASVTPVGMPELPLSLLKAPVTTAGLDVHLAQAR
jgi:hypothetical protein